VAPTTVRVGQFLEAGPAAFRNIVLLAAVDEHLSLRDGLAGLVDDPDIDGASGGREAERGEEQSEGE
jgi:hypothetical protein